MNDTYQKRTFRLPTKITAIFTLCAFLLNLIVPQVVIAQSTISLPVPGTMVSMSAVFQPTVLRAVTIDPQNPFQFDFVIDAGQSQLSNDELKEESTKLVKYFLTSLTVPEKDIWVNLSPFEKDKIVPNEFGITEMGKDLLSQDYLLKQLTATLIYPEVELGKLFWDKVYEKAQTLFGTTNIPISTFNKIWIVPDKAVVYEKGHTAFVVEAHLKVMLEEDYLAFLKSFNKEEQTPNTEELGNVTSSTLKEMIIPEIEKEINQGKNFTQLRQIYYSLILASWYKKRLKESLLSKIYTDQNKVVGIDVEDRNIKQKIYEQYLEAYKQGVYNFIKETYDPTSQEMIPRKYFSGGVTALGLADEKMEIVQTPPEPESYTPLRRPLKIKVNLVRHSVVNEYIRTHLPDDLIDDPQNIENYPDGVIPIKGLFQETGQMGHIGLGQVYGRPVKYVDEEYKDNEDLLGHEDDEITQWENKREKLGLRPREMREWILNNYDEAKKLADQYHNKARSVEHLYDGMDITEIYSSDSDERDTNLAAHTEKLPRVNKEEELVVFSTVGFERHLIRGTEIWKNFKKEVGEAAKYAGPTKTIKVGEENFILVRRQSGRHIVFTLDQERFEKLVRLKDWSFKSTVPDAAANDVIFSYVGFDKYLISGQGVWRTFKKEIGEADEYTEPTKIMKVGEENFTLIRKRSGTNIVFTLDQERFKQLVRLKGWSFKAKVPDAAASDVSFSQTSFDKYLVGGARVWQTFREEIGEAKEYPEPAKIMKAGEENFTLIRKRSGSNIVFTLDQKKFEQLVRLKGWIFKTKVPDAAASDVIFSQISFDKYLVGGGGVWQTFREEIGEAKEYPEPTKTIKVGEENFILIRKRSGGGHTVFTLNQEKFERLARLKGWAFKATVPDAAASDVIFSQISFDKYLIGGGGVWQTFREEIGEAKEYPEPTKTIKVGEENFILIRKQSAGRIVFTLNQERFEQLVRLKKWPPRSKIPDEDIHDVVFLPKSFDEYLIGGARIWQIFKQEIGEADEYPEPTKTIKVGEENFILVRKQSGKRIVFTLNQKRFEQLMRLKGWLFKVPDIEATDVIFSRPGFGKYLKYEGKIWQTFRQEIGEANEYPEPTKTIKVGKENFILIRKRSGGGHTVFTLNQEKFERLARLKGWAFKAKVPDVEANDVVFSANSFQLYFTGAKGIWERLKKEVGEAAEFTEPTKTLKVGEEIFTLVRKRSGAYVVFTLDKERFEQLARLKDWPLKKVNNANAIEEYIENHLEIQDAIASTIEDPEALYAYLMFTDVPVEMARGIVIESFHGIRGAARTISDLDDYNNYTETDDQMTLEEVPSETADLRFTMRGKVPAGYSQVQIYVDRDRIVDVDENGHFTVNFILERGKVAQFGFFGINEEAQTRTKSTVITVSQTSPPKDIGAIFDELLSKKEELQVKIFNNKEQLKYLTKRMEISALKHFTEDEKEGFLYLDQKIEQMKSPFMKQLYRFIKEKFEEIDAFEVEDLRKSEKLYFYEKYAIRETTERMNDPNNPSKGVILALEQGLGKTLVALSAVRKDPNGAAIIVPNAVVTTWGEQEGHFFEDKETETHIITGTGVQKAKKIEEAGNKSKVVNLEYIRDKKHVMGLNKNPKQVLVLDESQFISRPGSQQSEGATDIKRRFTILISATPFANTEAARSVIKFLERGNKGLEDSKVFKRLFDTNDPESLRLLHFWFNQYLIRIKKRDVFKEYDKSKPLEEQKDRLPSKEFISPEELGEYELTPEQADAQLQMFTDWLGWVQRKIASGGVKTEDDAIIQKRERDENYFSKMHSLRQMSNTPKYIGIDQESPKLKTMDKIVEKEVINKNGKVVIFAQYRNQVKEYLSRYADLNAISYYGDTEHEKPTIKGYLATEDGQKLRLFKKKNRYEYDIDLNGLLIEDPKGDPITSLDYNRLVFQNDPTAKVLIATYDSGAVGVTFTAADAVIFDDLARDYTVQYQAEDRANRIDNLRKKYAVRYYNLIAKYPESFINKVRDLYQVTDSYNSKKLVTADEITDEMEQDDNLEIESLYDLYFSNGTYDQVHFKNLQAQKRIFELILDGLQDQKDMDLITNKRLKEKFPGLFTVTKHGKIIDEQPDEEFKEIEERIENGNGDGNGNGENKDSAMISNGEQGSKPQDVGGIDFNPNNINLEIKNDGKDISIPIDEQQIQMDHIGGFTPVIINITSILNFPQVLGLKENEEDVNVEYSLSKDSER